MSCKDLKWALARRTSVLLAILWPKKKLPGSYSSVLAALQAECGAESAQPDLPHIWAAERGAQARWVAPQRASRPGQTAIMEVLTRRQCPGHAMSATETRVQATFGTPVVDVNRVQELPGAAHGRRGRVACRAVGAVCVHLRATIRER